VTERSGVNGVLTGGTDPRIESESKIRTRINKAVQDARAASDEVQVRKIEEAYHESAHVVRGGRRKAISSATRRAAYQPNAAKTDLDRIKLERLAEAIAVIRPASTGPAGASLGTRSQWRRSACARVSSNSKEDWRSLLKISWRAMRGEGGHPLGCLQVS
jgi:hypothetical protein